MAGVTRRPFPFLHHGYCTPIKQNIEAVLRLQALALLALADEISVDRRAAAGDYTALAPLTGSALRAAKFITANPGLSGEAIAASIGINAERFRGRIVPRLKAHGYWNVRGGPRPGYYPPGWKPPSLEIQSAAM